MVSSKSEIENKIYQEFNHIIYPSWRKKVIPLGVVSIGLLYLMYVVSFFDLHNIGKRWNTERPHFLHSILMHIKFTFKAIGRTLFN